MLFYNHCHKWWTVTDEGRFQSQDLGHVGSANNLQKLFCKKNNDARWHIWQAKWQNEIGALYFCWVLASGWIGSHGCFIIRAFRGRLARGLLTPTIFYIWELSDLLSACTVCVDCVVLCFAILLMSPIKPIPVEEYLDIYLANCWAAWTRQGMVTLVTITPLAWALNTVLAACLIGLSTPE